MKNIISTTTIQYKHVSYLWNESKAAKFAGDEVALLVYRANLLGADLRLTNYGGGNTSCKAMAKDFLTGKYRLKHLGQWLGRRKSKSVWYNCR